MRKFLLLFSILFFANLSYASPTDWDEDGVLNAVDNCPYTSNPTQIDTDMDGIGDTCDCSPTVSNPGDYQGVIFVNYAATGLNNGKSWANAFTSLESALVEARLCPNVQIWVAKGTYKPSAYPQNITGSPTLTSRDFTFHLVDGVKMYGGFNGTESSINERVLGNETILSGDLAGDDIIFGSGNTLTINNNEENLYHVVLSLGNIGVNLDTFTISGGNANGAGDVFITGIYRGQYEGGGLSLRGGFNTVINCKILNNSGQNGGGAYIYGSNNIITKCTFSENLAPVSLSGAGGGLLLFNSTTTWDKNTIVGNKSYNGGGVTANYCNNTFLNNNISLNSSSASGGGITLYGSLFAQSFINNTFFGNIGQSGGAIFSEGSPSETYLNNIFWDNRKNGSTSVAGADIGHFLGVSSATASVTFCLLQEGSFYTLGTGNINGINPNFANSTDIDGPDNFYGTTDDGLNLQPTSPAINASDPTTGSPTTDITGFTRIGVFDSGAYEATKPCPYIFTAGRAYVMQSATGANNGSNWSDAFTDFQSALEATRNCGVTEIWVAQGTYLPSKDVSDVVPAFDRNKTFFINKDVKIYGGFIGGETALSARLPDTYITTLSGDIGVAGVNNDNAIHVITIDGVPATSTLDGFTITKGNSDNVMGTSSFDGAGIFLTESNIVIEDCKFTSNLADTGGGAIALWATSGIFISPKISNCYFNQNIAMGDGDAAFFPSVTNAGGGAIRLYSQGTSSICNPTIEKCIFDNNYTIHGHGGAINSTGSYSTPIITNSVFSKNQSGVTPTYLTNGGAIFNQSYKATITNSVFEGNVAAAGGGGIYSLNDDPKILNCTFYNNTADTGGAMENTNSNPKITNCIIWRNSSSIQNQSVSFKNTTAKIAASTPDITFTDIEGGYTGVGNINLNPLFTDASNPAGADGLWMTADDGLILKTTSLAINAGSNTLVTLPRDLTDAARIQNSIVDMGSYETFISGAPLPIKLISFTAKAQQNQVQLTWKTSSETNSAGFEIERSENGKDFTKIGYVKSEANNGNSNESLGYNFIDQTPPPGVGATDASGLFYRLKQLDLNGKFEYSKIKFVKIEGKDAISIYPNPTTDFINIETFGQKIKSIELLDARGSVFYIENKAVDKIDLSNKPTGFYFLKIEDVEGKIVVRKITKD